MNKWGIDLLYSHYRHDFAYKLNENLIDYRADNDVNIAIDM